MADKLTLVTWEEWERDVLASANEDGVVVAWETRPYLDGLQRLISMQLRGLVTRRDGLQGGPWIVTEAGRRALKGGEDGR